MQFSSDLSILCASTVHMLTVYDNLLFIEANLEEITRIKFTIIIDCTVILIDNFGIAERMEQQFSSAVL